jgi:murein tripeptide amidase MpaA
VIDYLTSPAGEGLRQNYIFKIFPMLNADGVVVGNYRCGIEGHDLNRRWHKPNKYVHPTIYYIKKYIRGFAKER